MRIAIIINPVAGRQGRRPSTGAYRVARAERLLDPLGLAAEIVTTLDRGHAAELSRGFVARGFDVVMAWGGDGTVNEVAGPIIGSTTALGVIPSGSGDGLARSLRLPIDTTAAFAVAVRADAAPIDVGYLGERHFLNVAGIGFDAAVAADFNTSRRRGALGYVTRIARLIWRYSPDRYDVRLDGHRQTGPLLLVAFANGREYGNRLQIAPEADPRDGWLNAVLVDVRPPSQQLWRARRLAFRPGRPTAGIVRVPFTSGSVAGDRLQCQVDGETFDAAGRIDVRIASGALRVCGVA